MDLWGYTIYDIHYESYYFYEDKTTYEKLLQIEEEIKNHEEKGQRIKQYWGIEYEKYIKKSREINEKIGEIRLNRRIPTLLYYEIIKETEFMTDNEIINFYVHIGKDKLNNEHNFTNHVRKIKNNIIYGVIKKYYYAGLHEKGLSFLEKIIDIEKEKKLGSMGLFFLLYKTIINDKKEYFIHEYLKEIDKLSGRIWIHGIKLSSVIINSSNGEYISYLEDITQEFKEIYKEEVGVSIFDTMMYNIHVAKLNIYI